jgi:hypothetical protein
VVLVVELLQRLRVLVEKVETELSVAEVAVEVLVVMQLRVSEEKVVMDL